MNNTFFLISSLSFRRVVNVVQFLWVIPRRLCVTGRRFGTLYRFHLHRHEGMKMEPIERSETSASNTQTPGNYPKETVLHIHSLFK
jgi:hypothetical protein